jgi:flavin reductase (DIM6/NTAB) family NADH-FMN oxidoreductase RutF
MARWATGVAIVTARDGASDAGLTVNALLSVSLVPPSLLISLTRDADTTPVIARSRAFAATFLAADQRELSERFAKTLPPSEKFTGVPVHRGLTGAPLPDGALGSIECRVVSTTPAFDHELFLGEVVAIELGPDRAPLVFQRSGYADAESDGRLRLPPSRR